MKDRHRHSNNYPTATEPPAAMATLQRDFSVLEFQTESTVMSNRVIGLFGAETKTGHHFLRAALDAGYLVRALLLPNYPSESEYPNLEWIRGESLFDTEAIAMVVNDVDYVVCMSNAADSAGNAMNDEPPPSHAMMPRKEQAPSSIDSAKPIASFMQLLYPIMKQQTSIQVFLFQASSLASDTKGKTPVFSKVLKSARSAQSMALSAVLRNRSNHQQQTPKVDSLADIDSCIHEISTHHKRSAHCRAKFRYVITRPTNFLHDGPSKGVVVASKSQPGMLPIQHVDLAVFSLHALVKRRLHDSCPYVVSDRF